jgi:ArsR family transcriptional regulator
MANVMSRPSSNLGTGNGRPRAAEGDLSAMRDLSPEASLDLVSLFKLLGDETRLRILHYLAQREELNVTTLCRLLKQSQPAVSHHLALLRLDGLIECRRGGKHNYYRLLPQRLGRALGHVLELSGSAARGWQIGDIIVRVAAVEPVP